MKELTLQIYMTVHKDITERLPLLNEVVAGQVKEILENNKAERHLRGGMATKRKYAEAGQRRLAKVAGNI